MTQMIIHFDFVIELIWFDYKIMNSVSIFIKLQYRNVVNLAYLVNLVIFHRSKSGNLMMYMQTSVIFSCINPSI